MWACHQKMCRRWKYQVCLCHLGHTVDTAYNRPIETTQTDICSVFTVCLTHTLIQINILTCTTKVWLRLRPQGVFKGRIFKSQYREVQASVQPSCFFSHCQLVDDDMMLNVGVTSVKCTVVQHTQGIMGIENSKSTH